MLNSYSPTISEKEKNAILVGIDREFYSHFQAPPQKTAYKTYSSGLALPAAVALIALILSLVSIVISDRFITGSQTHEELSAMEIHSESEWAVLKAYKQKIEKKLLAKDIEIQSNRKKIEEYDQRLEVLRNLIALKRKTGGRLSEEGDRLALAGFENNAIETKILEMEEHLLSDLSPDMVEFYGLSVEGLNSKIDQLLIEKEKLKKSLETVIAEKEQIAGEKTKLIENMESTTGGESLPQDILGETELRREQNELFTHFIQNKYLEIFEDMKLENLKLSLQKLERVEELIWDAYNSNHIMESEQYNFHMKMLTYLQQQINEKNDFLKQQSFLIEGDSPLLKELATLSSNLEYDFYTGSYETAENRLRRKVESVPELAAAFNILQKVDGEAVQTLPIPTAATPAPAELKILPRGRITGINFNKLTILCENPESLMKGTEFSIIRKHNDGEVTILGQGSITSLDGNILKGELETLYDFSLKPEISDSILFEK